MARLISRRDGLLLAGAALTVGALPRLALADTLDDIKKAGTIKVGCGVMGTKP